MPDEEDFISLWKKKMASENNKPSVIRDTLEKVALLQKENEELRKKIEQNINLISRSEEIIKKTVEEKEILKSEVNDRLKQLEEENTELGNKVKSMVKLLLEKDEEIKDKEKQLSNLKAAGISSTSSSNQALIEDLKLELTKKTTHISELTAENERLQQQILKNRKDLPVDYVIPVENTEPSVIKPQPPETSSLPLEQLCQDLQSDLNKYKKMIDQLNDEKSQLTQVLENKGLKFNPEEIASLKAENESLKNDLEELQKSLKKEDQSGIKETNLEYESKIKELTTKLIEKEDIITKLKLSQGTQAIGGSGPMSNLIEELQNNINKLKATINEKDEKIKQLQESRSL